MHKTLIFIVLLVGWMSNRAAASVWDDSTATNTDTYQHKRSRAALFSAIIPGAGQIYNEIGYRRYANKKHRAWWKVPIIYGGLGVCGYYFYHNNKFANLTKQEWLERDANEDLVYYDQRFSGLSKDDLIGGNTTVEFPGYDIYARRRDIFIFAFIGVWGLNVIESYVDAHFVTFDVSEDLSLTTYPTMLGPRQPGISLNLQFN